MKAFFAVLVLAFSSTFLMAQNDSAPADPLTGDWSYTVDTPDDIYKGTMNFTNGDEGYVGKLITPSGTADMKNRKFENNVLSFSAYAEGFYVTIKGNIEKNVFSGEVNVDEGYFIMKGKKIEGK